MNALLSPDQAGLLIGLLLLIASLILIATIAYFLTATRALNFQFVLRIASHQHTGRGSMRFAITAAVALLIALVLWLLSPREVIAIRVTLLALGAATAVIVSSYLWNLLLARSRIRIEESARLHHDLERTLRELRTLRTVPEILARAERALKEVLELQTVVTFREIDGGFAALAEDGVPQIRTDSALAEELMRPRILPLQLIAGAAGGGSVVSAEAASKLVAERLFLISLEGHALAPIRRETHLVGFWLLGRRESDSPYSPEEGRFLAKLGGEVAACLDWTINIGSFAAAHGAAVAQAQAVEMRRETKLLLCSREKCPVEGLDYGGAARISASPDSESFAFLPLPEGRLGILLTKAAVGSPAHALALARFQGWLQAQPGLPDMAAMHTHLGPSVRFFYARFDAPRRRFDYWNSDYSAPFALRRTAQGGRIQRLSEAPTGAWELNPGDIIVAANPALTSLLSPGGEMWTEADLIQALLDWTGQPAQDVAEIALRTALDFAAREEPAEDLLVVLLRAV